MKQMVEQGEVDALVPERVWQELSRGLMEQKPSRMLEVLRDCGALARILPELDALWGVPQPEKWHPEIDTGIHVLQVIDCAARLERDLPTRFACLMHDLGKGVTPPQTGRRTTAMKAGRQAGGAGVQALRVPTECRDLAVMTAREHGNVGRALQLRANTIVTLFERCDAFRKPARFTQMLLATECDSRGRIGPNASYADAPFPQLAHLETALAAARGVNAGEIAHPASTIRNASLSACMPRVCAVKAALKEPTTKTSLNEHGRSGHGAVLAVQIGQRHVVHFLCRALLALQSMRSNVKQASSTSQTVNPRLPAIRTVASTELLVETPAITSVSRPRSRRCASSPVRMNALLVCLANSVSPAAAAPPANAWPGWPGR
jgi:hypothetical protein